MTAALRFTARAVVPTSNTVLETEGIVPAAYVALDEIDVTDSLLSDYELTLDFKDA